MAFVTPVPSLVLSSLPPLLVDGERRLDLLMELEIGIRKRPAVMYEIDEEMFSLEPMMDVQKGDDNE